MAFDRIAITSRSLSAQGRDNYDSIFRKEAKEVKAPSRDGQTYEEQLDTMVANGL